MNSRDRSQQVVLVVDDEKHIRRLYAEELSEEGYVVATTDTGMGLLQIIGSKKPDLVILDIKMMDFNGMDLLQDIRNHHYDLPVIICSAYDIYRDDPRTMAADYYVVKSFDLGELKHKIRKALQGSQLLSTQGRGREMIWEGLMRANGEA